MTIKRRAYDIVETAQAGDRASQWFDWTIIALIVLSIIANVLETVGPIYAAVPGVFRQFESLSVSVFTVEYAARLWSCTEHPDYRAPVSGRLRYALRPMLVVDLLAILPFYLPMLGVDLRLFRALRLFRLARVAKLARYTMALTVIGRVLRDKKEELITTLAFLVVLLLLASSVMYYAERAAQPEGFGSIPEAMWWGVATLTTVGYGDATPVTPLGQILGAAIAVLGIGMFALPTAILGSGFVDEVAKRKTSGGEACPHCGEVLSRSAAR